MQQNRALFFAIIGVAILFVLALIVGSWLLFGSVGEVSPLQQNVSITVVADSAIEPWLTDAAQQFNEESAKIQVRVVDANSLIPANLFRGQTPPAAWVAQATFIVEMAEEQGLTFDEVQSVASTPLAWGGYSDKLAAFLSEGDLLTWETVSELATAPEGFKLVIMSPQNSAEGIAALGSATAAHLGQDAITGSDISVANQWLTNTLGNSVQTPPTPAQSFASPMGRTLGDAGLLSIAAWRRAGLDQNNNFVIQPLEPTVTLDIPFAIWTGAGATPEHQEAARAFRVFLLENEQQTNLDDLFLSPATAGQNEITIDGSAADRLLGWADRVLN